MNLIPSLPTDGVVANLEAECRRDGFKIQASEVEETKIGWRRTKNQICYQSQAYSTVDEDKVRKIVKVTNSELVLDQEDICRLQANINDNLEWYVPRIDNAGWTDIEALRDAVKEFKKKFHVETGGCLP